MFGDNTKEKIFTTAVDMLSTLGYSESTMRELASRVGVKPSSLYYHYQSKDDLLNEIFDRFLEIDRQCRLPLETIVKRAPGLPVPEILDMMFVRYRNEDDMLFALKVLRIAIGYQFECRKAREVFDYFFFEKALTFRQSVFDELIRRGTLAPFDSYTVAYTMTSCSLMRVIESMNNRRALDQYSSLYYESIGKLVRLLSPLIEKAPAGHAP